MHIANIVAKKKIIRLLYQLHALFVGVQKILKFSGSLILKTPGIFIIEYNICHQEVVVGMHTIANMTGLKPIVVVASEQEIESDAYYQSLGVDVFYLPYYAIKFTLSNGLLPRDAKVFICSSFDYRINQDGFDSWLSKSLASNNLFAIVHTPSTVVSSNALGLMASRRRLFCLSDAAEERFGLPSLHLSFGQNCIPSGLITSVSLISCAIRFVVPGTGGLDVNILSEALLSLYRDSSFACSIVILGNLSSHQESVLRQFSCVSMLGRVPSERFMQVVSESDFLIGPTATARYIEHAAFSGSVQCSRSLLKPLVIASNLGYALKMPSSSFIGYPSSNLSLGLMSAMGLSVEQLEKMKSEISNYNKKVLLKSSFAFNELVCG